MSEAYFRLDQNDSILESFEAVWLSGETITLRIDYTNVILYDPQKPEFEQKRAAITEIVYRAGYADVYYEER